MQEDWTAHVVHEDLLGVTRLGKLGVGGNVELVSGLDGNLIVSSGPSPRHSWQLTSVSFFIKPVRISGPLVSRAMASGRPPNFFSAARALSMTD